MRVLAVDLSLSRTAWCLPDGTVGGYTTKPDASTAERALCIAEEILYEVRFNRADLVVKEGPSYGSKGSATLKLGKLHGIVEAAFLNETVQIVDVSPSSIKKYATGSGRAGKAEVLTAAVRRLGYTGHDDNEADALWLHALVMDAVGSPTVKVPKEHRGAVKAVRETLNVKEAA